MADQCNSHIRNTPEELSELVQTNQSTSQLQGIKTGGKPKRHSLTKCKELSRRYTPVPPPKVIQNHVMAKDDMSPAPRCRGRKIVQQSQSVPSQLKPATAKKSPPPRKPQSAPIQMSPAFSWTIQQRTNYCDKSSVASGNLHGKLSGIRSRTGHDEAQLFQSSHHTLHREKVKGAHAKVTPTASVKLDENEVETICKDVDGLSSRHKVIMKEGRWKPISSSQHRETKMPNLPEVHGRETKKGIDKNGNRGKRLVCISSSMPLPRLPPNKASLSRASPSPRKPKSAPVQPLSAFQWPAFQEESDPPASRFNKRHARRAILRYPYHVQPQTRRMRLLETEGEDCGTIADDGNDYDDVFDLSPIAGSQPPQVVNYPQKSVVSQHRETIADLAPTFGEGELNVPKYVHDMMRSSSPDSFVSQLITNSKGLTLYDSTESPTLQERKKKARVPKKKIDQVESDDVARGSCL